jgi:hypothetical protein
VAQLGDRRVWGAARTRQHRTLVYIIKRVPRVSLVHISGGFRIMHGAEANEGHDEEEYPWLKMVNDAAGNEVWKDIVRGALAISP